jgi:hypothetical protein
MMLSILKAVSEVVFQLQSWDSGIEPTEATIR